jgi:hypothetical protein
MTAMTPAEFVLVTVVMVPGVVRVEQPDPMDPRKTAATRAAAARRTVGPSLEAADRMDVEVDSTFGLIFLFIIASNEHGPPSMSMASKKKNPAPSQRGRAVCAEKL